MATWRKLIQNTPKYPWLNWIRQEIKEYEGRIDREDWSKMKVGDTIEFYTVDGETLNTKIVAIEHYSNFDVAFDNCGLRLVPIKGITRNQVQKKYNKIFKMTTEEIAKHGVVAIKLMVLE